MQRNREGIPTNLFDLGVFLSTMAVYCPPFSAPEINESDNQTAPKRSEELDGAVKGVPAASSAGWSPALLCLFMRA